jgi:predicted porin
MKHAVLATAILTALVSGTSFAASVYDKEGTTLAVGGRANANFTISDANKSATTGAFKDGSYARVNLVGKSAISEDLYGFGKYEAQLENSDSLTNRYFYAGMGTTFGEFSYGKQDSAQVQLTDFTDVLNTFSGKANKLVAGNGSKLENNFAYTGVFDALTVKANYVAADEDNTIDTSSMGLSGIYAIDDNVRLGLGYVSQEVDADTSDYQVNLAGEVKMDAVTFSALYLTGTVNEQDSDGVEATIKYKIDKTALYATYQYEQDDSIDVVDFIALEVEHKFNGSLRTYVGYQFNQLENSDDALQAGVRYDF